MKAYDIIKTVRLTEKGSAQSEFDQYTGGGRHSGQQISDP